MLLFGFAAAVALVEERLKRGQPKMVRTPYAKLNHFLCGGFEEGELTYLASRPGDVGKRAYDAMEQAFNAENLVIRVTGETIALTPPLIVSEREIEDIFAKVARVIRAVA